MNAQCRSVTSRQIAERTYPHRVDIPVPPFGLGRRLDKMLAWCQENVPHGEWAQHGWEERRGGGVDPKQWARFYFVDDDRAEEFRQLWS